MLGDCVELGEAGPQLFQLLELLVSEDLGLLVLFFDLGELLGQISQSLGGILHLLEDVGFILIHNVV